MLVRGKTRDLRKLLLCFHFRPTPEIKVVQRFKFNALSDNTAPERQAVVIGVFSNRDEGLGPEVDFYLAYWGEAYEPPEK